MSHPRVTHCWHTQVGIDIGFHVQSFLSEADMGVRMTGGNVAVMGDMVRQREQVSRLVFRAGMHNAPGPTPHLVHGTASDVPVQREIHSETGSRVHQLR